MSELKRENRKLKYELDKNRAEVDQLQRRCALLEEIIHEKITIPALKEAQNKGEPLVLDLCIPDQSLKNDQGIVCMPVDTANLLVQCNVDTKKFEKERLYRVFQNDIDHFLLEDYQKLEMDKQNGIEQSDLFDYIVDAVHAIDFAEGDFSFILKTTIGGAE
ncbi:hypothetical protein MH050_03625 [Bacillus licheniformis]|uniref:hypothetical protein n=1 Tax=Bacillus TaxID=1386 RepID=UPI0011A39EDC|nr:MULTISPECIES: hypothetical protein [Bacillus]MBU8787767.1 hypothetical protein [Bacillus glycinifermentans]MCA1181458.1 hypothetical protein [Bacillus licheniformis]MCM3210417.1 hypothetical protein [Bacillus licheniformis]MCM3286023.1 hypothetical protein [Bacillus licheniformis]MCY7739938.1 hypothetical protein [Bacillus licheniformis]